ncbi:MAG: bifunctional hydroxymethylpyrimidine kinase/phosphomethylpyrimidine kinase [Chloroflexota bacterium]|nr:bifunctional hydroxymethylpyrimidine kinase/phosphomethylpyrimidine kinase [Chloroflexota bacterium]
MAEAEPPKALTVAGSDSGGGAGIQADLKTFAALGVYGASAITAVTARNTERVLAVWRVDAELVAAQIDAVLGDIGAQAVKTGMLGSAETVRVVADRMVRHDVRNLVVDTVLAATSGQPLLDSDGLQALVEELLPLAAVATPNIPEAEILVGHLIASEQQIREAARAIHALGARAVLVKGGHLGGPTADDLLFDGQRFHTFQAERVDTPHTHGTGCTFSAAITAGLAKGLPLLEAVSAAKAYVTEALRQAYPVGRGRSPVNHFYSRR